MNKRKKLRLLVGALVALVLIVAGYFYIPSILGDSFCSVPAEYVRPIRDAVTEANYDNPYRLAALLWVESGFNPKAVSGAGAAGIAQFMQSTANSVAATAGIATPVNRFDPVVSIRLSARLLEYYAARYQNLASPYDDIAPLAAYNIGSGGVDDLVQGGSLNRMPRGYAQKVMAVESCMRLGNRNLFALPVEIKKVSTVESTQTFWRGILGLVLKFPEN